MPIFWISSTVMIIVLLFILMLLYFYKKENMISEFDLFIGFKNFCFLW